MSEYTQMKPPSVADPKDIPKPRNFGMSFLTLGVWIITTATLTAFICWYAIHVDEYSYVRFQLGEENLITVKSDEPYAIRDQFTLRFVMSIVCVVLSAAWGIAVTLYVRWNLSRWFSSEANAALLGGFFVYGIAWMFTLQSIRIPESLSISLFVWTFSVISTYPLLAVFFAGMQHLMEQRSGRVARGARRILYAIVYSASAVSLCMLIVAGMVELLGLFVRR